MFEYFHRFPYPSTKVIFSVAQKRSFVLFYSVARFPDVFCIGWFLGLTFNAARIMFCRNCASNLPDKWQSAFARDAVDSGLLVLLCFISMCETSLGRLIGGTIVDFYFLWEDCFNLKGYWTGVRKNYSNHVFLLWPNGFVMFLDYLVSRETILSKNLTKKFVFVIKTLRIADWMFCMNEGRIRFFRLHPWQNTPGKRAIK